jgi:hypothetical protein
MAVLKDIAVMVRGCYTLLSEVLYPQQQFARHRAARTWALAIMATELNAYVSRKALSKLVRFESVVDHVHLFRENSPPCAFLSQCGLTSAETKDILSTIAVVENMKPHIGDDMLLPRERPYQRPTEDTDAFPPKFSTPSLPLEKRRGWRLKRVDVMRETQFVKLIR